MMLNIQGFTPDANSAQYWKLDYLSNYIVTSNTFFPFIALTETWLKPNHSDAQIHINNYNILRSDRLHRSRGGALLYVHDAVTVTSTDTYDDDICQAVFMESSPVKLLVACVYKPCVSQAIPQRKLHNSFTNLLSFLQDCIKNTVNSDEYTIIILGDFNFPNLWKVDNNHVVATSDSEKKLMQFMNTNFLSQYIDVATREMNILDLFISNNDRLVQHTLSEKHKISDHNLVEIMIPHSDIFPNDTLTSKLNEVELHGFNALDLYNADFSKITESLANINWEDLWANSTLEKFPATLQKVVLEICVKHCSLKLSKNNNKHSPHQRSYHKLLRKRRKLKTRLNCLTELKPSSPKIPKLQLEIDNILLGLKELSYSQQKQNEHNAVKKIKTNPKYFYSYVKRLAKTKNNISQLFKDTGEVITDRKEIANTLQAQFASAFSNPHNHNKQIPAPTKPKATLSTIDFNINDLIRAINEINENSSCPDFSIPAIVLKKCKNELAKPLLLMWNESIRCGIVPSLYKQQLITPVFKKGSRSLPSNYRPVSLTAHEVKIFERVLRNKMVDFLEGNNLLSCKQHGFRKGRSCLSQLLKQHDDILTNLMNNMETDVIYLDFAKAFDKVDHAILLQKLKNIGIDGELLDWISDFLLNRKQVVVVNGILSYLTEVLSGVPQGTVLGPLLFLIYLNDITNCLNSCDLSCFADDTRIYKSISYSEHTKLLQDDLINVSNWSLHNNMKLHADKFVYVNFNTRSSKFPLANLPFYKDNFQYITSEGTILETTDSVLDLGITFSEDLSWNHHTYSIAKKAKQKAGWVLSAFKDRSPSVMKTLYKSLIRSLLEYCCPLWSGLSLENMRELESVQRSFSYRVNCPSSVKNYWDRLQYLQLMSLQRRRERYIIIQVWKILNELTSNDLNMDFYDNPRFGIMARVPSINNTSNHKARTLYDLSFAVMGPRLWNIVPKVTKECTSLFSFKTHLDSFLKTFPDQPPVTGYVSQNNNSILDWNIADRRTL